MSIPLYRLYHYLNLQLSCIVEFDIARDMLYSSKSTLEIDPQAVEDICLSCSQEFYDNASSGNYHFGDMKLAFEW